MWQPIETAPKDGSEVIGFGSFFSGDYFPKQIWVMSWQEKEIEQDAGDGLYRKVKVGQWCSCGFYPTHWMPLPAPPLAASEDDDIIFDKAPESEGPQTLADIGMCEADFR